MSLWLLKTRDPLGYFKKCIISRIKPLYTLTDTSGGSGSGGRVVVWQLEGCWFDPRVRLAMCLGVHEQDTIQPMLAVALHS